MTGKAAYTFFALVLAPATQVVAAQMSAPPMVSALPDLQYISAANTAGALQYCLNNGLVSTTAADAVTAALTARRGLTKSRDYSAGLAGRIISGEKSFALPQALPHLRSHACDMVLRRAQQFK